MYVMGSGFVVYDRVRVRVCGVGDGEGLHR
jgi:hypothetical protein